MASSTITVRPALPTDLPQIHAIQVYYVEHTVMNFSYTPASLSDMQASYADVLREGFPYLVAVSASEILGYTYASPFRLRAAYQHTAELSVFVRADTTNQGIGGMLLAKILENLREARQKRGEINDKDGVTESIETKRGQNICQLLAIMTVDPNSDMADKLRRFYERFGFKEVGRLEKIGWKNGMWLDTRYMQVEV